MKKIISLFVIVFTLFISCSSSDDNSEQQVTLTCAQAEQNVIAAFNNSVSLGTIEACNAYKAAVLAQATPCGYTVTCLTDRITDRGIDCTIGSSGTADVGSSAIVDEGSGIAGCD